MKYHVECEQCKAEVEVEVISPRTNWLPGFCIRCGARKIAVRESTEPSEEG